MERRNYLLLSFVFGVVLLVPFARTLISNQYPRSNVRGSGYEYPRYSFPGEQTKVQPRWLVIAGRKVIPGSIYRIAVESFRSNFLDQKLPITVRTAIARDGQQIAFGNVRVQPGELSYVLLEIPDASVDGDWQLRVEGYEGVSQRSLFKNTTALIYTPTFLTILIQTSRPVYNAEQTVRFRVVMLTRELLRYEEPVDIYILDPQGRAMRRWPSRPTGDGVINLHFDLPEYPVVGNWTIQVKARQQVQNKTIIVEKYFKPRFEVFVRLPQTFNVMDEAVTGVVVANMTNWRDVHGNCSVKLQVATNDDFPIPTRFETVHSEFLYNFTGVYPFHIPMETLARRSSSTKEVIVRVYASVGDTFGWQIQHGWALARIVQEEAKLTFLGDQPLFIKPGMPVSVHIFVSYKDNHPFGEEELENSQMTVIFKSFKTETIMVNGSDLAEEGGVVMCTSEIPKESQRLEVSASFVSSSGLTAAATLIGLFHHSPRGHHLQVETSTSNAVPGEFIILHVRCNFYTPHINFLVVANGLLVYSDREANNDIGYPTITTFSLPASSEMSPVAKILVWVLDSNWEVISHSISIPVTPLGKHKVGVRWNDHKDHSGGSAEVKMLGEPGSFFATSAVWEETHLMDAENDFNEARILHHMMGFHDSGYIISNDILPHIRRASTRSRDGFGSNVRFFPTSIAGPDAPTTFNFTEVVLLTDAMIYYHPSKSTDAALCEGHRLPCLTGGCYSIEERCDGSVTCADFSDEAGCPVNIDPWRNFRIYRSSRMYRFYDPIDGDWAWRDTRGFGSEIQVFPIPKRPQSWVYSMFAVGKKFGLGLMQEKIQFDSAGPFMITAEGPPVARMWEQVGIRVSVFNFHDSMVGILITLPSSEDYQCIAVEDNGIVESYNPRKVEGTFQHIVWLPPAESYDVHIPIIFKRMGTVEVTVQGSTQMQKDSHSVSINVIPEGAGLTAHTSIILDLKDRALVYDFMDIHLDESPIIPYSLKRRYVFGTPGGTMSICGDIVGPAFPNIPMTEGNMIGFGSQGAETSSYDFGANIWTLHYLRLTNQITDDIMYKVLTAVNVHYAALVRFQEDDGGFSNWIGSEPSVWLTAYVMKNLWIANFQDWENLIYIDHKIIQKGVQWILDYQTESGSFQETEYYLHPLDSKVEPRSRHDWMPKYQNISLTAHVVVTLVSVLPGIEGELHNRANFALQRAVRYLETVVNILTDPYDLALTAWALNRANSEEKDFAFSALDKLKRVDGDRIYWSREPVALNQLIFEDNQKPYLQPKSDNKWDAHSVETSAYALLVYIKNDGIGVVQENIVRFLNVMREMDGGMISSIDSLAALEALVEYSYRARIRDITNMHIEIEQSANPNSTIDVTLIGAQHLAEIRTFDLNGVFGHVSIVGRGAGQALFQLAYGFGVDVPEALDVPPVPAFDFHIHARFTGRNNSYITITACQSWINGEETETSGLAVVDVHLPSGYYIMQDELIEMVESRSVRNLRWARRTETQVKFFFNYLDEEPICFSYRLERWYPVANHSRHNMATVYELYQPERFIQLLFEVYPLYVLDICEVCGSYQCPYCPFYSGSQGSSPILLSIIFLSSILVFKEIFW